MWSSLRILAPCLPHLNDSQRIWSSLRILALYLPHLIPLILWCDLLSFQSQRIRRKIVVLSGDISGHYMFHRLKFYTRETPPSLPPAPEIKTESKRERGGGGGGGLWWISGTRLREYVKAPNFDRFFTKNIFTP
jgi:hypothetical protein